MKRNTPPVASPCVRNCCLNNDDICLGCFRSLYEITHWTQVNEKTQKLYLDHARQRRESHDRKYQPS